MSVTIKSIESKIMLSLKYNKLISTLIVCKWKLNLQANYSNTNDIVTAVSS